MARLSSAAANDSRFSVPQSYAQRESDTQRAFDDWLASTQEGPWLYRSASHAFGRPMATFSTELVRRLIKGEVAGQSSGMMPGAQGGVCNAANSAPRTLNAAWIPHPGAPETFFDERTLSWESSGNTTELAWELHMKPQDRFSALRQLNDLLKERFSGESSWLANFNAFVAHYRVVFPTEGFRKYPAKRVGLTNVLRALQGATATETIGVYLDPPASEDSVRRTLANRFAAPVPDDSLSVQTIDGTDTWKGLVRVVHNPFAASSYDRLPCDHLSLEIRVTHLARALASAIPALVARLATGYFDDVTQGDSPLPLIADPTRSGRDLANAFDAVQTVWRTDLSQFPFNGPTILAIAPLWQWSHWPCVRDAQQPRLTQATNEWLTTVQTDPQAWLRDPAPALMRWTKDADFSFALFHCVLPNDIKVPPQGPDCLN